MKIINNSTGRFCLCVGGNPIRFDSKAEGRFVASTVLECDTFSSEGMADERARSLIPGVSVQIGELTPEESQANAAHKTDSAFLARAMSYSAVITINGRPIRSTAPPGIAGAFSLKFEMCEPEDATTFGSAMVVKESSLGRLEAKPRECLINRRGNGLFLTLDGEPIRFLEKPNIGCHPYQRIRPQIEVCAEDEATRFRDQNEAESYAVFVLKEPRKFGILQLTAEQAMENLRRRDAAQKSKETAEADAAKAQKEGTFILTLDGNPIALVSNGMFVVDFKQCDRLSATRFTGSDNAQRAGAQLHEGPAGRKITDIKRLDIQPLTDEEVQTPPTEVETKERFKGDIFKLQELTRAGYSPEEAAQILTDHPGAPQMAVPDMQMRGAPPSWGSS